MNVTQSQMVALVIVVLFVPSFMTPQKEVHNCSCQKRGNKYTQLAQYHCEKFTQYDNTTKLTHTQSCPPGLRFSMDTCVCVWAQDVACEGCGPLRCEVEFTERFDEMLELRRTGNCSGSTDIIKDLLPKCIVKDPVARILGIFRIIDARQKETDCPIPEIGKGCDGLPNCLLLVMSPILDNDGTPKFLCENFREAMRCYSCFERNGCQVVKGYADSLRGAAAKLCPLLREFTCPADKSLFYSF